MTDNAKMVGPVTRQQSRRSRIAENAMRVYSDWSHARNAPIDRRRAALGPDVYRVFRGWQWMHHDQSYSQLRRLTNQRQVVESMYNLEPGSTNEARLEYLSAVIANDIAQQGFPDERMRHVRSLADPRAQSTRIYDELRSDPRSTPIPVSSYW